MYCYVCKVAHLLWIFIEVFLQRARLGCRKNVCYHCYLSGAFGGVGNLAQYHFVNVCACTLVCVCVLRMFSHSYQCVLGCASASAFCECKLTVLCMLKGNAKSLGGRNEKSASRRGHYKIIHKISKNIILKKKGGGQIESRWPKMVYVLNWMMSRNQISECHIKRKWKM